MLEELNAIEECARNLSNFHKENLDGSGKCLLDIKNTFDNAIQTLKDYKIIGTNYGDQLVTKANQAGEVILRMNTSLIKLTKSLAAFVENERDTLNGNIK